ncbi:MAG: DUF1835 domain-containing protein [Chitinophagia bacterium]|nr:DUF1835 domain-containing protein [Chitinophagia bacterium]
MVYHIVTGDFAAEAIRKGLAGSPDSAEHSIVVLKDILNVGPLLKRDGQRFSDLRTQFWHEVAPADKPLVVDDLERLLTTCNELSRFEAHELWIWTGGLPADICAYYLLMRYASRYIGKLNIVNTGGLPFLDDNGRLFFPRSIAELNAREIGKALKLVRPITASEAETDKDEWDKLVHENGGIRVLEGARKLVSKPIDLCDKQLLAFCTGQFQKANKIISLAMAQFNMPVGDLFLGWRLKKMVDDGRLQLQGDANGLPKEFEIKLHDGTLL